MKILIAVPTLASFPFLSRLCLDLLSGGSEVHLAASSFLFSQSFELDSIPVQYHEISFPRGANLISHLSAARQLRRLVDDVQPDVVDVHFSAAMLTTAIAKRNHWPPTVATVQGLRFPMQNGFRQTIEREIECWAARRMDEIAVLTPDDQEALKKCHVNNVVLQQAPGFGCDLDRFNRSAISQESQALAAKHAQVKEGEFVFIFIGRCAAFKGFDLVVRAFLGAQKQLPHLRLIVCGSRDNFHSSGLSADEEAIVANHPQISQLGWIENVEDYLAISGATLFPSKREGMPVNLMESLVLGVPVITCDARGCRDIVEHESTGLILPTFETDQFRDAMVRLATDTDLRNRLSQTALSIRNRFDQRHFSNERVLAFERLAAKNQRIRQSRRYE